MRPIAGIVITLVLLVLFIVALILKSRAVRNHRQAGRQRYAEEAVARGWRYDPVDNSLATAFTVKPFRRGATRRDKAQDAVSGILHGHHAVGFRYRYVRGTNPDNLSDVYSWFTVCAVRLPAEMEGVPPDRKSFAVDRDNDMVRRVMLRRRRSHWCIDGNWLMCWERGANLPLEVVLDRLELLSAIIDGHAGRINVTQS